MTALPAPLSPRLSCFPAISGLRRFRPLACNLPGGDVEAIPDVRHGDPEDQGGKRPLVVVASGRLAALRSGDVEGLVAVLDPDVVVHVDEAGARPGAPREVRGARTWAKGAVAFSQFARFAQPALVDGRVGLVMAPGGRLFRVLQFTITRGKIAQVDVVADPARLRELELAVLND